MSALALLLERYAHTFFPVVPTDFRRDRYAVADFSQHLTLSEADKVAAYLADICREAQATAAVGGYAEERRMYSQSPVFQQTDEPRNIHLGVDIWMPAGTAVYACAPGRVHSFQDNAAWGDYGPTILLEHRLEDTTYWTLYGHLSRESLHGLSEGMPVAGGQAIGALGSSEVNGGWLPHLHFQVIGDLRGKKGDFEGVTTRRLLPLFLEICPDPGIILGLPVPLC